MEKTICKGTIVINKSNLKNLKKFLKEKREFAGEIYLNPNKKIYDVKIPLKNVKKGEKTEIDAIISRYNFHVHPEIAYKENKTDLGWPSCDDYKSFVTGFLDFDNIFHILSTIEGIYFISIDKSSILPLKKLYNDMGDNLLNKVLYPFIEERINIDKYGFRVQKGIEIQDNNRIFLIKTPRDYINFINNVCIVADNKLFNIKFKPWGKLNKMTFEFYYPTLKNCKLKYK